MVAGKAWECCGQCLALRVFFLVCTDNLRSKDASGYVELLQSELGWAWAGAHSFCMLCNSLTDVGLLSFQDSPDVQVDLEHKAMEAGRFA